MINRHEFRGNFDNCATNYVRYTSYFQCTCANLAHFYFLSEIWRHLRVPRSWFLITRRNSSDSRIFKAEIGIIYVCMDFQTFWPKMTVLGDKIGEEWCDVEPQRTRSYFGGWYLYAIFGENRSRNATVRVHMHRQTDRQTAIRCDRAQTE